ncbi:MAG: hypothetical protein AAF337_11765 [Pseudomonadota bacterium]
MAPKDPPKQKPKDLAYAAYVVDFDETPQVFTNAYIGIETPRCDEAMGIAKRLELISLLSGPFAPDVIECGTVEDDTPPGSGQDRRLRQGRLLRRHQTPVPRHP